MAKVILESTDTSAFIAASDVTVYGSASTTDAVQVLAGAKVTTDASIERVQLALASSAYTYKTIEGGVEVLLNGVKVADVAPTKLAFADGSASVVSTFNPTTLTTAYTLGGKAVTATAAAVVPTFDAGSTPTTSSYTLAANTTSVTENGTVTFTITANPAVTAATTLTYSAVGDTLGGAATAATPNTDFTPASGTVTFAAGETTKTITLTIPNDNVAEGLEGFKFLLLDSNFATLASKTISITDDPTVGQQFTLTTAIDNYAGTAGNDTINGSYVDASGTGTTINPGDIINGGSGTDTVSIAASGTAAPGTLSAVNFTGVEKVLLSAYNTNGGAIAVDMSLADSALTTVGLSSSGGNAASFTNLNKVVNAEMKNGNSSLTLGFSTTANAGLTDVVSLAVSGAGSSAVPATFTAPLIETINVNSATVASTIAVVGSGMATLNIAGDTAVSVDVSSGTNSLLKNIDASTATGKVTVIAAGTPSTAFTAVKGGAGTTDVFTYTTTTAMTNTTLANVTGFEVYKPTGSGAAVTLTKAVTGLSSIDLSDTNGQTVTLSTGYTGDTAVTVGATTADTVTNTVANVNLTVSGTATAFATANIAGGTGTDTLKISADDAATTSALQTLRTLTGSTGINAITIVADTATPTKGLSINNVRSASTTDTLVVDASALTSTSAIFTLEAFASNAGKMSITGGAGNDVISLNTSTVSNTVLGGTGVDSITAGTGNDNINGGAGNDTIVMGGNLTANDTVDGGDGTGDTLSISALSSSAGFANVTNIETIAITGTTAASLSSTIGAAVTFDLADTAVQSVTLNTGYTGDTTVKIGATGIDAVTNNANVTLTVSGNGANFAAASIVGGTGTDTIKITADDTATSSGTQTARSLANVSGVDVITVSASSTTPSKGTSLTTGASTWTSTTKTMTVDASALGSTAIFTFDGALTAGYISVTGGAGNDVITGGTKHETLIGGAGNDTITGSATATTNDFIQAGDGNDTIVMAATLEFNDTVDGGAGTDTMTITAFDTGDLAHVTNVEVLAIASTTAMSFASDAVGFNTFDLTSTHASDITLQSGYTGDTTVKMGATNADKVTNSANIALTTTGNVTNYNGATIVGGTGVDTLKMTADAGSATLSTTSINLDAITILASTATPTNGATVTLGAAAVVTKGGTMTVDASDLTSASAVFTFDASPNTGTGKFSITGGAGNDVITGDDNADTIIGGSGDDSISGGTGLDVLTGGAGNDLFVISKNANGLTFATITDPTSGDAMKFTMLAQASQTVPTQMILASGATTLSDYITAATSGTAVGVMNWFQFGGNTYMVADNNAATTFIPTTDSIVQLTGLVDLSTSLIAASSTVATWVIGNTLPTTPGGLPVGAFALDGTGAQSLVGGVGNDVFTVTTIADWASAAAFDTLTGALGTDSINITDDTAFNVVDAQFTKATSIEKLTINTIGTRAHTITIGTNAQAAGFTTISLAGDTGNDDTLTVAASAYTVGVTLTAATGGAITSYTAGSGADSITGSSAVDTFVYGANLTLADTIAGGGNTDVLQVSGTLIDTAFTKVTTVETLDLTATGNVTLGTLATAAGFTKVTNSGNGGVTINSSASTSVLTITGGSGVDTITSGATAVTITGGVGADVITLGAANAVVDNIVWATGDGLDSITNFLEGTGGDKLNAGVSTGNATATLVSSADATTAISMASTDEVLVLRTADGTFADLAAVSTRLAVGTESFAAGDTYYVVWTATTGGLTHISLLTTDAGNTNITGADTLEDICTLAGTTNSTAITVANFAVVA